jgi:Fe-S cluster assembly scaffold IscU
MSNEFEYSDKVMDYFAHPRNVGSLDGEADNVGTGVAGSPACGDVMKLQIQVEDGVITDAKFKTFGCGSAIASSSLATEWLIGKTIEEAVTVSNLHIAKELELPQVKVHCSVLAEDAVLAAINDWKAKHGLPVDETVRPASDHDH